MPYWLVFSGMGRQALGDRRRVESPLAMHTTCNGGAESTDLVFESGRTPNPHPTLFRFPKGPFTRQIHRNFQCEVRRAFSLKYYPLKYTRARGVTRPPLPFTLCCCLFSLHGAGLPTSDFL